jgi:biotin operon repressor
MASAKHRLLISRELGVTSEWEHVHPEWAPGRISAEWTPERQLRAYFQDKLRKKALMQDRKSFSPEKTRAYADTLTRWSALPDTSMLFVGGHTATRDQYAESIDPRFFARELDFHTQVLDACGTLAYHPNFAYAMDVEAPGTGGNTKGKREAQTKLIEALQRRWKGLAFVVSSGDWSDMTDPRADSRIQQPNVIYRVGMYRPYAITHSHDSMFLGVRARYGITAEEAEALIAQEPKLSARAKELIREAVGFGRTQIKALMRSLKATGLPFLIQESGECRGDGRYLRDVRLEANAEAVPLMLFSAGGSDQWGQDFGLCIGQEPKNDGQRAQRRVFEVAMGLRAA